MTKFDYQVAVVGGGPAGSAAALRLTKRGYDVVLVESTNYQAPRVGETLAPTAKPLLKQLDAWDSFCQLNFKPSYGTVSAWGSSELASNEFIFNPHGQGWHLDRPCFDAFMAHIAEENGAVLLTEHRVTKCLDDRNGTWSLMVVDEASHKRQITVQAVIQATGRKAALSRWIGAQRLVYDHLVGIAVQYEGKNTADGYTLVESVPIGWWYSAPIPPNKIMVMLMTDADLCQKNHLLASDVFRDELSKTRHTESRVTNFHPKWQPRAYSAITHRLVRDSSSTHWLACGDAAMSVDPLSGSGMLRALNTGLLAGEAMANRLEGDVQFAKNYTQWLDYEFDQYWETRNAYYSLEKRWSHEPFWERRLVTA